MKITTPSFVFAAGTALQDRILPHHRDASVLNVNPTQTNKIGIKVYECVFGWILSILGIAVTLQDAYGRIFYANRNSMIGWANTNGAAEGFTWRNMEALLQNVVSRQQPVYDNEQLSREVVRLHEEVDRFAQKIHSHIHVKEEEPNLDSPRDDLCAICIEPVKNPIILKCGHAFDIECINEWFNTGATTCPIERQEVGVELIKKSMMLQKK